MDYAAKFITNVKDQTKWRSKNANAISTAPDDDTKKTAL